MWKEGVVKYRKEVLQSVERVCRRVRKESVVNCVNVLQSVKGRCYKVWKDRGARRGNT